MPDAKATITSLTGFGIIPAVLSFVLAYLFSKGEQGKTATIIAIALLAIGLPSFLALMWSDLGNSLKKDGSTDIDPSVAGTWVAISLMVSFLVGFIGMYMGHGKK